jgi:restriction endonuclease S subunit
MKTLDPFCIFITLVFLRNSIKIVTFVENILHNKLKKPLGDVAVIQSGIYAQPDVSGNVIYLQAKYFQENRYLDERVRPDLKLDSSVEKHLLREGDILFAAKGGNNFAVVIRNKMGPCVASSTFMVLKVDQHNPVILPDFLAWQLNHPKIQVKLKALAIGSNLLSISKAALEKVIIDIPPLSIQSTILAINELREREKQLKNQIEALREQQMFQLLLNKQPEKTISND